jgi:hypothetical protein
MRYEEAKPISKREVRLALRMSEDMASPAIVRAALTINDREWVESLVIGILTHDVRIQLRRASLVAAGHLARLHKRLNLETIVPLIRDCIREKELAGTAEDALEDITIYVEEGLPPVS